MGKKFVREVTLFEGADTREKFTVMDKWDVVEDDSRNFHFGEFDEFLEFGHRYRLTLEEIGGGHVTVYDEPEKRGG